MNSGKVESTTNTQVNRALARCKSLLACLDKELIILLTLPLLMIGIINMCFFLTTGIDPTLYFGFMLDLKQHLNTFMGTYYGTRLPWILPGFLAYRYFSPIIATYVLHLAFYYAAAISLYQILKQTIGRRSALLAAVLMGCHYYFIKAIGTKYIDGAALTYLLLTLWMLTNITKSRYYSLRLCLAGVFFGCVIYTQLFLVSYIPLLLLYYFFMSPKVQLAIRLRGLGFVLLGFVGLSILLCTINYFLNGTFFFFTPIVNWTSDFVSSGVNPWWHSITTWGMHAKWLILTALTFLGSVLVLIFHRSTQTLPHRRFLLFFQVFFILNVLLHVVFQLILKQPFLELDYYTSYMIPALFLALGSQLAIVINKVNRQQFYIFLSTIIIASFVISTFIITFPLMWLTILIGIGGLGILAIKHRYRKEIALLPLALVLTTVNLTHNDKKILIAPFILKPSFLSVIDGIHAAQSMDPLGNSLFWYNDHAPFGFVFKGVCSAYLWGYRIVNDELPEISTKVFPINPKLNSRVFLLSEKPNALEEVNINLAKIGFKGELINKKTIEQGPVSYKMTYIKVCNLEEPSSKEPANET